jgi:hypothetical protein
VPLRRAPTARAAAAPPTEVPNRSHRRRCSGWVTDVPAEMYDGCSGWLDVRHVPDRVMVDALLPDLVAQQVKTFFFPIPNTS